MGSEPETLHELLADEGIELHEIPRTGGKDHGGPRSKLYCPACHGGRQAERNFFVKIDPDGNGFRFMCHRASCGVTGGRRVKGTGTMGPSHWAPKVYRRPAPPIEAQRPDTLLSYFAGFGISADTVRAFGVYRTERRMPVLDAAGKEVKDAKPDYRPVIAYPYREDGALLNVKYKAIYNKGAAKRFVQEPDAEPSLYNIDAFTTGEDGYFVEGEDDALALWECGFRQVTSVVDGSPGKISKDYDPLTDNDKRYEAVRGNTRLAGLKRIFLAGDMDEAGRNHHEEIARRVGKARCWLVRWPDGCKDAKDTLQQRGRDAVRFAIECAEPYPLPGVEIISDEAITQLYQGLHSRRHMTGFAAIDQRITLNEEGQLVCTTGIPGHGKSTFWTAMGTMIAEHDELLARADLSLSSFHTVVFGAETENRRVVADIISQHTQKPFFPNKHVDRVGLEDVVEVNRTWVRRHFSFVHWPDRATQPTMSWVMVRFEELILRTGAKLAILDPWQEVDDEMPTTWRKTHSEWLGVVLQRWVGLAYRLRCNIILVVHPPKPRERNKDGTYPVPGGYDIGSSQGFFSRCNIGLTIHRPSTDRTDMLLRCWKTKDWRLAQVGDTLLRFDPSTSRLWPVPVDVDTLNPPLQTHRADLNG